MVQNLKMPFFSVIIPLYNKKDFIAKTLQSVLAQTFGDFEIIIVNDGSTDGSEAKIQQFSDPRIHYYLRENKGVSAARNLGITMSNADYIAFLDADDFWYPDFLQTMHRNIGRFTDQKVFAAAIEIETKRNVIPAEYSIEKTGYCEVVDFFKASTKETVIWTSAAVFHKSVFEKSGVFDAEIRSGQDTDLWIRIGLDFPVVFDWKIQARYVFDPISLSKNRNYTNTKINFSKFSELEKTNVDLKKFLDLNRYSLAIKSKLGNDSKGFSNFSKQIDTQNLTPRKRILLKLPASILKILLKFNQFLADNGLGNSVFR